MKKREADVFEDRYLIDCRGVDYSGITHNIYSDVSDDDFFKHMGNMLRFYREKFNYTRSYVARLINKSEIQVQRYEDAYDAQQFPKLNVLRFLFKLYDISPNDFFNVTIEKDILNPRNGMIYEYSIDTFDRVLKFKCPSCKFTGELYFGSIFEFLADILYVNSEFFTIRDVLLCGSCDLSYSSFYIHNSKDFSRLNDALLKLK